MLPLSALSPVAMQPVKDGALSVEVPHGTHLIFFVNVNEIEDPDGFCENPNIMPPGATGGAVIWCRGNPDEIVKIYKLDTNGD